jgi:hypothetical protein
VIFLTLAEVEHAGQVRFEEHQFELAIVVESDSQDEIFAESIGHDGRTNYECPLFALI